jgi:hypothetical protein
MPDLSALEVAAKPTPKAEILQSLPAIGVDIQAWADDSTDLTSCYLIAMPPKHHSNGGKTTPIINTGLNLHDKRWRIASGPPRPRRRSPSCTLSGGTFEQMAGDAAVRAGGAKPGYLDAASIHRQRTARMKPAA